MKRGIVMEINKRKAVVLTRDGAFENVRLHKNQQVEIGAEIDLPSSRINFNFMSLKYAFPIVVAAAVLLVFIFNFSIFKETNLAVAAYVDLDINPSIEIGVDANLNVVEAIPLNEDGEELIAALKQKEQVEPLSEFINRVIQLADDSGYFQASKNVLITTTAVDAESSERIVEQVESLKTNLQKEEIVVNTLEGDQNTRAEALENGVSTGKYIVYTSQQAKENSGLTLETVKQLSVAELNKQVNIEEIAQKQKSKKVNKKEQKSNETPANKNANNSNNKNDKKDKNDDYKRNNGNKNNNNGNNGANGNAKKSSNENQNNKRIEIKIGPSEEKEKNRGNGNQNNNRNSGNKNDVEIKIGPNEEKEKKTNKGNQNNNGNKNGVQIKIGPSEEKEKNRGNGNHNNNQNNGNKKDVEITIDANIQTEDKRNEGIKTLIDSLKQDIVLTK
ncbi:anti-sigma factor domain-containing protein [Bacillus sp. Marseille-P3661]|uniref:anti-sigma factor domain-containing protein n=1 Tax=Bacillus sp. Marseille-P3661 TaxID=1936234 RepID=UPI000C821F24|nr:anti-sigma factor domain-containing protein [Bacillus sp. Marseille-P3661]